jgi:Ca2+-binding RTX toxin-like protein
MAIPTKWLPDALLTSQFSPETDPHVAALRTGDFVVSETIFFSPSDPAFGWVRVPSGTGFTSAAVINGPADDESETSVAGLSSGEFVLTFTDRPDASGDADVFARFQAPGDIAFVPINQGDLVGNQTRSEVVELTTGLIAFAWYDGASVRSAIFTPLANVFRQAILVSSTSDATANGDLGLTALANGNYVVSWAGSTSDHFRVMSLSNPVSAEIALPTVNGTTDVTALTDGRFVASYFRTGSGHLAEIFNPDGSLSVGEFQLSTSVGSQATTALLDGRFMVVYDNGGDILGSIWNADGTRNSADFLVNSNTTGTQQHPHLDTLIDGRIAVSWEDSRTGAGDIYYTILDPRESGVDVAGTAFADEYFGGIGLDILSGGDGADKLHGGDGRDLLIGGPGDDQLFGDAGPDELHGGTGNDFYFVDDANDVIVEATGQGALDRVFASASYKLSPGASVEVMSTTDNVGTTPINLTGNELPQSIFGNAGDNILRGGGGGDGLIGFGGNDWYFVDDARDSVSEAIGQGDDRVFASVSWNMTQGQQIEKLSTANQAGTEAINLRGNDFNNFVVGNDGQNFLSGGLGNDNLVGLGGNDYFLFEQAPSLNNADYVPDFTIGQDHMLLQRAGGFASLAAGTLADANFMIRGTAFQDANDFIIWDAANGVLSYDADGSGAGAAQPIALLTPNLNLHASDILVV